MKQHNYLSSGCLTGYEVITGMRSDFTGNATTIAYSDDLGSLDAPSNIPAGSCVYSNNAWLPAVQSVTWRP